MGSDNEAKPLLGAKSGGLLQVKARHGGQMPNLAGQVSSYDRCAQQQYVDNHRTCPALLLSSMQVTNAAQTGMGRAEPGELSGASRPLTEVFPKWLAVCRRWYDSEWPVQTSSSK